MEIHLESPHQHDWPLNYMEDYAEESEPLSYMVSATGTLILAEPCLQPGH